jgi:hypothetical protein
LAREGGQEFLASPEWLRSVVERKESLDDGLAQAEEEWLRQREVEQLREQQTATTDLSPTSVMDEYLVGDMYEPRDDLVKSPKQKLQRQQAERLTELLRTQSEEHQRDVDDIKLMVTHRREQGTQQTQLREKQRRQAETVRLEQIATRFETLEVAAISETASRKISRVPVTADMAWDIADVKTLGSVLGRYRHQSVVPSRSNTPGQRSSALLQAERTTRAKLPDSGGDAPPSAGGDGWTADALFARVRALCLADEPAVAMMRGHVASGRFSVDYYVRMWGPRIRGAAAPLSTTSVPLGSNAARVGKPASDLRSLLLPSTLSVPAPLRRKEGAAFRNPFDESGELAADNGSAASLMADNLPLHE